ncbi:MAG: alpha-glucosidase/alpha-galactosidase [Anaerolineales bacterium]
MAKIVIIGAGSMVFSSRLTTDILCVPELREGTIVYVDIDREALDRIEAFAQQLVEQEGLPTTIEATTERRRALEGADYVVTTFRVGGMEATNLDISIPLKYGIDQAVGDTVGPGGIFYGQCHIPLIVAICRDMEELCPDALLLNHSNPMAMLCWALNEATSIRNVGLCHSVQGTSERLAQYMDIPYEELSYWVAGINHMAWFLRLERNHEDVYPLLRERLDAWDAAGGDKGEEIASQDRRSWARDTVRREIFRRFSYYVTESTHHMSEYVPYFRRTPELMEAYALIRREERMKEQSSASRREQRVEEIARKAQGKEPIPMKRSTEYSSRIIEACETDRMIRINGNVPNTDLITNLPPDCVVEVPCLVDALGIHPCHVGDLPPQLAGLNRSNISVQELAVKAALEGDREALFQAVALDPLTASTLSLDKIEVMVEEMFEALLPWMPQFQE